MRVACKMAVKFLSKQALETTPSQLETILTVINVVIRGFSGEDLKWFGHVTVRLQVSDYSQLSDYNLRWPNTVFARAFSDVHKDCKKQTCRQYSDHFRELKHRRFWTTDVNRKFMFLPLARFHAPPLSFKVLILAFETWHLLQKGSNTCRRGEISNSGWRPWLKNVCA